MRPLFINCGSHSIFCVNEVSISLGKFLVNIWLKPYFMHSLFESML